jgi:hypothetical protein
MRKFNEAQQKKAIKLLVQARDCLAEDLKDKMKSEVEVAFESGDVDGAGEVSGDARLQLRGEGWLVMEAIMMGASL